MRSTFSSRWLRVLELTWSPMAVQRLRCCHGLEEGLLFPTSFMFQPNASHGHTLTTPQDIPCISMHQSIVYRCLQTHKISLATVSGGVWISYMCSPVTLSGQTQRTRAVLALFSIILLLGFLLLESQMIDSPRRVDFDAMLAELHSLKRNAAWRESLGDPLDADPRPCFHERWF